ncbi:glycosyltransferase [Plectonema radiosum NIES-515]|uniref:Glycosyltransferase n=1 Tax=Plectonema radiosum NIES-515 TaxID=2986073 RepID=A0ABT3AXJ8_9CYAN|nr:glycosyltransferase family 2 protein [Plectonema radiosum]MCV3213853.1 glycosyltransferase [Plectonema radiosum NIES-515]
MSIPLKISIISPSFNSEKTIEKTILSVVSQQKNCHLEYIIIDGGSTDRTCEIINKYINSINLFISEADAGAYDAINKGISLATGDIIGIINSDDWYQNDAIKIVEQIFSNYLDIDVLYSPIDNYFEGEYVATFSPGDLDKLPIRFTLNHPSCFIKKSAYDLVGLYDLQYKIAADYDLILRLFISGFKFHYIDTPLAAYSLNGMSSAANFLERAKLIKECWRISKQTTRYQGENLDYQRNQAYLRWVLNEVFAIPARYFLKPPTARKVKTFINKYIKKPVSDDYGKW